MLARRRRKWYNMRYILRLNPTNYNFFISDYKGKQTCRITNKIQGKLVLKL